VIRGGLFFELDDVPRASCAIRRATLVMCLLGFEYEARMAVPVVLFPNGRDLVDGDVADVIVIVFQMEHVTFNFNNLAAEARRASAKDVDLVIDHFG
jgi:hypothetical protein